MGLPPKVGPPLGVLDKSSKGLLLQGTEGVVARTVVPFWRADVAGDVVVRSRRSGAPV
jgi:hypothetical protein